MESNRRSSLPSRQRKVKRNSTLCKLPSDHGCTVLPALASFDNLLPSEVEAMPVIDIEIDDAAQLPISPKTALHLDELEATWHIVVLGRTFQNYTSEQVASALADELGMDADLARQKARAASSVHAFVVETSKFCSDASIKAEALRNKGLSVSITSRDGLPASASDVVPVKPEGRRSSYSELFRKAGSECPSRRRSLGRSDTSRSETLSLSKLDVMAEDPVESLWKSEGAQSHSRSHKLRDLVMKHKDEIVDEALQHDSNIKDRASRFDSNSSNGRSTVIRNPKARHATLSMWDATLDTAESEILARKSTSERKDACEILRFMIFGEILESNDHRDFVFVLRTGTQDDMCTLNHFWTMMDVEKSGRVDHGEFRRYGERRLKWQFSEKESDCCSPLLTCPTDDNLDKFISGLCSKIAGQLFGKKGCMTLNDMMKLIWLRATQADLKKMHAWCKEAGKLPMRVPAPPVLPASDYKDLVSIYQHFDTHKEGHLSFERLVEVGLLHDYQIAQAKKDWDEDDNGTLELEEFCEMMCPLGFRAMASSLVGSRRDGTRVVYDEGLSCWRVDTEGLPLEMTETVDRSDSKSSASQIHEVPAMSPKARATAVRFFSND